MSKVNVLDQGWIDLVFEGRNQNYGAYQLRKENPRTTMIALFTGISFVALLISVPVIINLLQSPPPFVDEPVIDVTPSVIEVEPYKIPETPIAKPEPIVESAAPAAQSVTPTVELKPFSATSEPTPVLPTTDDFKNADPGASTTAGTGTTINLQPGTAPDGQGTSTAPSTGTGPGTIETIVDVAPVYPGGLDRFRKDVGERFRTPEVNDATIMRVYVSFVVEPDGTLSNIKATRDPGYGMGAEAVRVLKSLKAKWTPGMKGGKAVRTAYSLPITVKVN
ncbi:energy transducer TonB [Flavobacterium sp. DG1-102-2]|uniref:energy transducer TonB n=1 Tax=Flavobacterium sp. DG1-102-2 TaxID=3081663 RepID=UPI0029491313|nr:energy transducer TonB [Flavobacterium sp. DG1-102-2]MDV6169878.1 energy transducer TonB [Flavobacterium sp. DG1-102-2]